MKNSGLALLLALSVARAAFPARARWGVAAPPGLDLRLRAQLSQEAARNGAELVTLTSPREAARLRVSMLIELDEARGGAEAFLGALKRAAGPAAARLTPELASQGYIMDVTYSSRSSKPRRIRATARTPEGFHNALLRVADLVRVWPSSLSTGLAPRPQALRAAKGGANVALADFPSFPARGIVEGFYGPPWSHQDRLEMLRFEGQHRMNAYYYAPKDDPYHRKLWAEPYPPEQMKQLHELVESARANFVDFCFAVSPGLSMTYSSEQDFRKLTAKLASVGQLGVSCFALFLDDVPPELESPEDRARYGTLAQAHVDVINKLHRHLVSLSPGNRLTVTPTTYTNAWGSRDYIRELGAGVDPEVELVWTGTETVSPRITVPQAEEWGRLLHRRPLVWDNFPVNDGIPWRLNLGPLRGRDPGLPGAVRGLVSNPMNQAQASKIPLATIAEYLWNPRAYDPDRAQRQALLEQYGKDAGKLLAAYLQTYGDYWWQENIFKPIFVESRKPINAPRIQTRIAALEASLGPLRKRERFAKLLPNISPFASRTRARLTQVERDPAFRHLPDGKLLWREDYDALEAPRVTPTPRLDGDFSKWQRRTVYALNNVSQIRSNPAVWKGPEQFSLRVAFGWDDRYFYVGADVTGPELYQPFTGRDIAKGDYFRLTLETAFRKNFARQRADGDEYQLLFSPGNFAGVAPSLFSEEDYLPPRPHPRHYAQEIKTAWKKTSTGFSGDIAIPVEYFEGGKFRAGYEIGLSFGARKAFPPPQAGEEGEHIAFGSKADRLFPAEFGNPSSYQRLVLKEQAGVGGGI
jgi:hypothetical protein